jgi:hypothetical protein
VACSGVVSILQVIVRALLITFGMLLAIFVFTYWHEALHLIPIRYWNMNFKIQVIKDKVFNFIPMAVLIGVKEFKGFEYKNMPKDLRRKFFVIASMPYFVLVPLFYYLSEIDNYPILFVTMVMLIAHLINFPLEFFSPKWAKKIEKKMWVNE